MREIIIIVWIISVIVLAILGGYAVVCIADNTGSKVLKWLKQKLSSVYVVYYSDIENYSPITSYATVYAINRNEAYKLFRQRKSSRYEVIRIEKS